MKKIVAVLIFTTLLCVAAFGANLTIRAYDVTASPAPGPDINADIYCSTWPGLFTGFQTPHTFSGPDFRAGDWYCVKTGYTSWLPESMTFSNTSINQAYSFYAIPDETVPVELSSFTATLTAENFVNLTWVSQSETIMLGYRVYRSETNVQSDALMITPTLIQATNTSTTQTYSLIDEEVEIGETYYYWLECVDMGSSQFHGPVSVIVEGEVPPVNPQYSTMTSAYPNPFKTSTGTSIDVTVKEGEQGTFTIYNIIGQQVKTIVLSEGSHTIAWDGRNAEGDTCGSGIYFYKLSTPTASKTMKMVIVK